MNWPRASLRLAVAAALAVQVSAAAAQAPKAKPSAPPAKGAGVPAKPGGTATLPPAAQKAKDGPDNGSKDAATTPAPAPEPPPPYEAKLLRLSEILGTLTYLRDLCGDGDGREWRRRMGELIDAEGGPQQRKERLAGAFNRGLRGYQFTYHACTAAAQTIIERLLDEGDHITREVASRYAG